MTYRIRDWQRYFENAQSRKLKRLDWVAIPNKTDGEGYTALVDHPNGAAHLGAWYAIVEAASKQTPRGNLPAGIGHDSGGKSQRISRICQSLGRMSRLPPKVFEEALPRLVDIGWIEAVQDDQVVTNQQTVRDLVAESANVSGESANVVAESAITSAKVVSTGKGIELQGITGNGTTATALLSEQSEFPEMLSEIRKHDAAADAPFARRLMHTVVQYALSKPDFPPAMYPEINDRNVARCIAESYRTGPPNHGTGLLLDRVPRIVHTWSLED